MNDYRQRFVFDDLDMRGCIVRLQQTCEAIQSTHHYPPKLAQVINQFALSAALLRDSIKVAGSLTIQLRTQGALQLVMADCLSDRRIRAIAEFDQNALIANDPIHLSTLNRTPNQGAVLAITITPDEGERYQSIVPIEQASLAQCLDDYFIRSEQLPSTFRLLANADQALGIAIHTLPAAKVTDQAKANEHFQRIALLLSTLDTEEALNLNSEQLLTRLFHQEPCRMFEAHPVEFGCQCSSEKSLDALQSLGQDEVSQLIVEQQELGKNSIQVDCHFCFQRYEYNFQQVNRLFA